MNQPMMPHIAPGTVALFLDVDGTLIDIAPHPDAVVVPASLIDDLERANAVLKGAIAFVSGRTIANLDQLFHPLRMRASGVHGAEYRLDPDQREIVAGATALPVEVWMDLCRLLEGFPGTMAENKAYSFAVHYRSAPLAGGVLQSALDAFVEAWRDQALRIMPGHFVFEVKRADFDKGFAVERFMNRDEFRDRRPIFIGDDVTDWPGFAAARRWNGLAYSVGNLAPDAMGTFPHPSAVRHWLGQLILSETVNA